MNIQKLEKYIGKLFFDKKGKMYIIVELTTHKYKGQFIQSVKYYPCSDNGGLIYKTKEYKKKASEIFSSKFTFVNN